MDNCVWYVVRAEREGRVWQSVFSHFDDAKAYVDELWSGYKLARLEDDTLRFHVYIDQETGRRPPNGEFPKYPENAEESSE